MARVITFSKVFPAYHPKKGQPTFFKDLLLTSLGLKEVQLVEEWGQTPDPKHHTIRSGHRWKAGDIFSPRQWSGKPYASKQETICQDIEIVKTYDFSIRNTEFLLHGLQLNEEMVKLIAKNDGLSLEDFIAWFKHPCEFEGQIICWNDKINYL